MKNSELKKILIAEDGPYCWCCNLHQNYPSTTELDLHHVIIHDSKRFHDKVTNRYNCCLICRDCHPYCNGHDFRVKFLGFQIKKYGQEPVREWVNSLPEKMEVEAWTVKMVTEPYDKTK